MKPSQTVGFAQGAFFLATGLWPLVSLRTFEWVTGPKLEGWLVKGVGVLISSIGISMLWAAKEDRIRPETIALANGAGLGLGALDVIYVARGRIKPIYLADAVIEALFAGGWYAARRAESNCASAGLEAPAPAITP